MRKVKHIFKSFLDFAFSRAKHPSHPGFSLLFFVTFQTVTTQSVTMRVAITTDQNGNISDFVLSACCSTVETWILRGYQVLQVEFLTTYTNILQVTMRA